MVEISNESELKACFRDFDQEKIFLSEKVQFPLRISDSFSWVDPSGHRAYLVLRRTGSSQPLGVAFRRGAVSPEVSPKMCSWCNRVQGGSAVGMMTASASKTRSVGLHLCRDLACKERLLDKPSVNDMRETLFKEQKIVRLIEKMNQFANKMIL